MFAVVIVIASCSRSSKPAVVEQPLKPEASISAPVATSPVPVATPAPVAAKAKPRRAATLSYTNREYGLSFNFPGNYRLKTQPKSDDAAQMNFVQPGGITLAAIELPGNSYPGTDFKSGTVNVSVNPGMTPEACTQFAYPEAMGTETSPLKTEQVKLGAIKFNKVETSDRAMMKEADAKYYHMFGNGACYEFALGVGTDSDNNVEEITPVDRKEVFGKLEKILTTVKLRPAVMPETQTPQAGTQNSTTLNQTSTTEASPTQTSSTQMPASDGPSTTPQNTSAHSPEKTAEPVQERGAPVPNL
jgi:hypothetical protein